ncbi:uncharacterized protein [Panulirus ornatus]|uniref:uncharacterized protein n=1 Tax=Panulirus ornatus TaxID=150431 RepID=UPI003A89BAE8
MKMSASDSKPMVGVTVGECQRNKARNPPCLRFAGLPNLNQMEDPTRPGPSVRPPRRGTRNKPSLMRQARQVRSVPTSGSSLEYDISRARSLEVGELLRGGLPRSFFDVPDSTVQAPGFCPVGERRCCEAEVKGAEALPMAFPKKTRRQESVTYEEAIPVIVRRRGCTLTVRIVSVEDIEVSPREPKVKLAQIALPHQPKSLSALSLPQVSPSKPS